MFGLFKKKTKLEQLIAKDGLEHATTRFAEIVSQKLPTRDFAYKFILEELDGASRGNDVSQRFARDSGIPASEYLGALDKSSPEIDRSEGPQQLLLGLSMQLMPNQALVAEFRCKVADKVMKRFGLGRYAPIAPLKAEAKAESAKAKNYAIKPNGFTVEDGESGDGLAAVIRDGEFHAAISMKGAGSGALAPWPMSKNPFDDDNHFSGSGMSPQGPWSFSIRPSAPFSQILREAKEEYMRNSSANGLAVRERTLLDVVEKSSTAKLGVFASMGEDVRASASSFVGNDVLFGSAGYAILLGACGAYVAGGVHPKLITDYSAVAKTLLDGIEQDRTLQAACKKQAFDLGSAYVRGLTPEAAEVILRAGLQLEVFTEQGEARLSAEEVVRRAQLKARSEVA